MPLAEWLLDEGVGEHRAALVEDGAILEAAIDRQDDRLRVGAVIAARLGELVRADPVLAAALDLLRRAARETGARRLVASPAVIARIESRPDWLAALAARIGGQAGLRADPALATSAGHAEPF